MTRTRIISAIAAAFIAAATAAPAFAGGEAKNEGPFTRPVAVQPTSAGEPKNELPFTSAGQDRPTITVTSTRDGFSWLDAAIGAAAGAGLTCAGAGLAAFAWATRRSAAHAQ